MRSSRTTMTYALLWTLAGAGKLMIGAIMNSFSQDNSSYAGVNPRRRSQSLNFSQHSFSSILNRLKREGLVTCTGPKKKTVWSITKKGRGVLAKKQTKREYERPVELPTVDEIVRLVSFDVPEKENLARRWLHGELLASGFKPLHKSVFIGKRPLPENLIQELDYRNLSRYVHIVALGQAGTLLGWESRSRIFTTKKA